MSAAAHCRSRHRALTRREEERQSAIEAPERRRALAAPLHTSLRSGRIRASQRPRYLTRHVQTGSGTWNTLWTLLILLAAVLAVVFGLAASFLMSRASNYSAAANIGFGALFVLALAGLIFLIVIITERAAFG